MFWLGIHLVSIMILEGLVRSHHHKFSSKHCVVHMEDPVSKINDGKLKDMSKDHKIVWICPSSNVC